LSSIRNLRTRAIALAGIEFDGYPSFVAPETGLPAHDVFLMLCFVRTKIAHCTRTPAQGGHHLDHPRAGVPGDCCHDKALQRLCTPSPNLASAGSIRKREKLGCSARRMQRTSSR
jgi:4-hydroxythreonine-4-phosphate dehydrogenase